MATHLPQTPLNGIAKRLSRANSFNTDKIEQKVLAEWVSGQRRARHKETLLPDRQARVEALGFKW